MNNIPQGYKQTELGIIPEDWEIKKILQIGAVVTGSTPSRNITEYWNGNFHWVSAIDFSSKYIRKTNETLTNLGRKQCRVIPEGSVLVTCIASIGLNAIVTTECATNQQINAVICNNNVYNEYIYYQICNQKRALLLLAGQTAVPIISKSEFQDFAIAIPSNIEEQKKIATALSNVDALIAALDKKIAKKCFIKQGAMQQLLTGKIRLAGFSDTWIEKKIYEIGELTSSGVDKKNIAGEQSVRLVNFLDVFRKDRIFNKDLHFWTTASDVKVKTCNVLQGDIFFTPSSEMPYDIALSAVAMENMNSVCYSYHIYRFRLFENIDLQYRAYMFKTSSFYEQANVACEGSGKRYVISLSKFNDLTICYPTDKQEQHAIATILSDLDKEIADLEARRDKYKLIKSGIMQKLLTGQIRLPF